MNNKITFCPNCFLESRMSEDVCRLCGATLDKKEYKMNKLTVLFVWVLVFSLGFVFGKFIQGVMTNCIPN